MNEWLNWTSNFYNTICWRDCPPHHYCLFCHKLINHMWVGLFIGSLFCYIDYYVFFNASTILFCFLLILNIVWDQGDRCLWIWSSFLRFLSGTFIVPYKVLKLQVLMLCKMPFEFDREFIESVYYSE